MKWIVLGATLLGAGCMQLPTERGASPATKPAAEVPAPAPPSVAPEEINEKNAHAKAEALMHELDWAAQERVAVPVAVHPTDK
jgi:hypothetical protein